MRLCMHVVCVYYISVCMHVGYREKKSAVIIGFFFNFAVRQKRRRYTSMEYN